MKFKPFQIQDYAAAAMADGLVLAHDTGLGKSLAAAVWPLLKLGFEVNSESFTIQNSKFNIRVKGSVLLVAPGDLHSQLCAEFKKFFGIVPTSIDDQARLLSIMQNAECRMQNGRQRIPPGFYITSYTRLAVNGVRKISDLMKCPAQTVIEEFNLKLADLQAFYDDRGRIYKDEYATLGVALTCPGKQLDAALAAKLKATQNWDDCKSADAHRFELRRCHDILANFVAPFVVVPFDDAAPRVKYVWRELLAAKHAEFSQGIRETRNYELRMENGESLPDSDTSKFKIQNSQFAVKCVYSPLMADLCSHLFECVVIDEGVKMKGCDTQVGQGIRQMAPRYRLVLTATPVKNRLPDIFWLAWWAAGGHVEATARWPYAGDAEEQQKFAETFMLSEFNKTKARENGGAKSRFTKLRPEICNLHLLWKALGPIVLRRRKQDIGQAIVQKVRHVYRVPMGLHQRRVYEYHLDALYIDRNMKPAPGAQLQALRVAAAAPDSHLLQARPLRSAGGRVPPLIHRSPYSFTPKVACALTLIRDILARGEQAAVFSAFNDPSDILSRYLTEAGIAHYLLDGRTNQRKRGLCSARFNAGECAITLAGLDSMAEGHNWDNVNNIILTSYTWAADKQVQAINRAHRITSRKDINLYVIICDQSADRVLEDNINEKTNSSELAIDGRLLGEATDERSIAELLQEAMRDFKDHQDCPDEEALTLTWPALRAQLIEAAKARRSGVRELAPALVSAAPHTMIDLDTFQFPPSAIRQSPSSPVFLPPWRRCRLAA